MTVQENRFVRKYIVIITYLLFFLPCFSFASSTGTITNDIESSYIAAQSLENGTVSVAAGVNIELSDVSNVTNKITSDGSIIANAAAKDSTAVAGGINIEDCSVVGDIINIVTAAGKDGITAQATGKTSTAVAAGINLQSQAVIDGDITQYVDVTSVTAEAEGKKSTAVAAGICVK